MSTILSSRRRHFNSGGGIDFLVTVSLFLTNIFEKSLHPLCTVKNERPLTLRELHGISIRNIEKVLKYAKT